MDSLVDIPPPEVIASRLSVSDAGRVFWWKGRLFRGIAPGDVAHVRRLFDCGLVAALVEQGLLVKSWIAPLALEGYGLVVEHEVVPVPTYPREWTWSMLRDAALLVLEVNAIAARYGYQTKDCHGYNVLFRGGRPVFVDLGSVAPMDSGGDVLYAYHEFMRSYAYPLQVWRTGGQYFGVRAVPSVISILPAAAYLKHRWPFLRRFREATLDGLVQRWHALRTLAHRDLTGLAGRYPRWVIRTLSWLKQSALLSRPARVGALKRTIARLAPPRETTAWSHYHDGIDESTAAGSRFDQVVAKIARLGADSVLELGGNQGALARRLAAEGRVRTVICTDRDAYALDKGYCAARRASLGVEWAILDAISHETGRLEIAAEERLRADVVVALALTHHLVLGQNIALGYVLDVIGQYARRHVLIEFMPLGLHDGTSAPALPAWYSEAWFRDEFSRRFEILERAQLEENRVLYVGKTR